MQDVSGMFHKREIGVRNDTYTRAEIDAKDGAIQAAADKAQQTADSATEKNRTQDTQIAALQKTSHTHSNKDVLDKTEQPYTTAERDKLAGLENYVHPAHTAYNKGMYKVAVDDEGHVTEAETMTKEDIYNAGGVIQSELTFQDYIGDIPLAFMTLFYGGGLRNIAEIGFDRRDDDGKRNFSLKLGGWQDKSTGRLDLVDYIGCQYTITPDPNNSYGTQHYYYVLPAGKSGTIALTSDIPDISEKQDKLTAGTNITISGNTISAKDTTYGNASASVAGLMSAEDKTSLDSMSLLHLNVGGSTNFVGVKFKVNRVSARFMVMENNGERADIYISIRIGVDTKAKVYVSGNTNSEYKVFYDNLDYVYVIFNCQLWSYIVCTSTVRIENMIEWRGTSYPTGLTGIPMDIQILLDTGNYINYALPKDGTAKKAEMLSSGQMRSAYGYNDDATFSNGYAWFKIGTAIASGGYATVTTTFLGICGYGKHALYTARIRLTSAGNAVESISFLESGRTGGMLTGLFRIVAINGEKNVTFELWAKGASRWEGTKVVILNEMNLAGGGQSNFWTLTSRGNADAKTTPTTGNMHIDSSDSSVCATAAKSTEANTLTDSGWVAVSNFSVNTSSFSQITTSFRKYGDIIFIRGRVQPKSNMTSISLCSTTSTSLTGITPSHSVRGVGISSDGLAPFSVNVTTSPANSVILKGNFLADKIYDFEFSYMK
mgnify:CR=1 FL=1